MGFPNDAEFTNFTARLELLYRDEAVPPRVPRETSVDALGYGRWEGEYVLRRDRGADHETATRAIEAEIRAIWHTPVPPVTPPPGVPGTHPNPLIGRLHYKPGPDGYWYDDGEP